MLVINSLLCRNNHIKEIKYKLLNCSRLYKLLSSETRTFTDDLNYRLSTPVIKERLQSMKASFSEGYTCYKLSKCVFCKNDYCNSSGDLQLFINKKTGNFLCHQCKRSGRWSALGRVTTCDKRSEHFDEESHCDVYDAVHQWKNVINDSYDLSQVDNEKLSFIMQDFGIIHWSKEVIQKLCVRFDMKRKKMLFPICCHNTIVGYMSLEPSGNCSTFPKTDCPGLLLYNGEKKSSQVIIVADIKDLFALAQNNLQQHIICLPYGVKALPQNLLPSFEIYNKIILWLGENFGAWNASIQFAKKLVEKRCYLIRPTENQTSAVRAILNGSKINQIVSNAKPIWHQSVTTFGTLREDVLAELQNINEIVGIPWSRFPLLNNILKGHRRGELTVLTGPTGAGKTTFLSEYSLDLAMNGVNTLWGSFEIKNSRLARTMLQQFSQTYLTIDNMDLFNFWADKFENLPIYFLTFHGQHLLKSVMNAVEHCSYTYDIAHVIIDNVQFMIDIASDTKYLARFWTQDCIIQTFRKFATSHNCHVTLVIHPRKELESSDLGMNSIFGSAKAAQEADNILILQENTETRKKYLQVCKNRFTGDLGRIPLNFDRKTLSFAQNRKSETVDMQEFAVEASPQRI